MSKTIFITGSSTGLGRATAILFAQKGWKVIATLRNPEKETELGNLPGVTLMQLDVTKPEQITEVVSRALALGPVDVVLNNAGYGLVGPFEAMTDEQLVSEIDTNLLGTMRVTRAFLPAFRARRSGTFIATTSIGGFMTLPFNSPYHATKWGLEGFSESLSFELAKFGIRVKTVAPGAIQTDYFTRSMVFAEHSAYAHLVSRVFSVFSAGAESGTFSSPERIAEVVYEAATDERDQITYLAGDDAKALFAERLKSGAERFRRTIKAQFLD